MEETICSFTSLHRVMLSLTQSSQSGRSDQLHQLVVAHVSQQVLQPPFSSKGRQLVSAASPAAWGPWDGRVVQVLVHFATVLLVLVTLWLLKTHDIAVLRNILNWLLGGAPTA